MRKTLSKSIVAILLMAFSAVMAANFEFTFKSSNTFNFDFSFGLGTKRESAFLMLSTFGSANCYFLDESAPAGTQYLYRDVRLGNANVVSTWKLYSLKGDSIKFVLGSGSIPSGATLALYKANGNAKVIDITNNAKATLDPNTTYYIQYAEKGKTPVPIAPNRVTLSMKRLPAEKLVFSLNDVIPAGYMLPSGFTLAGDAAASALDADTEVIYENFGTITYSNNIGTVTLPSSSIDSDITSLEFLCWFKATSGSSKSESGKITVLLTSEKPYLSIDPVSAEVSAAGGTALELGCDFNLESNVSWTIRSDCDWLVPTVTSGTNINPHVTYDIAPNLAEESRVGHLIVESPDTYAATFTVTQAAAQSESYEMALNRGWNFISPTHLLKEDSIAALLEKYPVLTINQSGNGYEKVTTLNPGLPYWFYAQNNSVEQVTGFVLEDSWEQPVIVNGKWSFIGVATSAATPESTSTVWEWDTATQSFVIADAFTPGKAYMVFTDAN